MGRRRKLSWRVSATPLGYGLLLLLQPAPVTPRILATRHRLTSNHPPLLLPPHSFLFLLQRACGRAQQQRVVLLAKGRRPAHTDTKAEEEHPQSPPCAVLSEPAVPPSPASCNGACRDPLSRPAHLGCPFEGLPGPRRRPSRGSIHARPARDALLARSGCRGVLQRPAWRSGASAWVPSSRWPLKAMRRGRGSASSSRGSSSSSNNRMPGHGRR